MLHTDPMQICACVWIMTGQKLCGQSELGLWAAAPSLAAGPTFSKTTPKQATTCTLPLVDCLGALALRWTTL